MYYSTTSSDEDDIGRVYKTVIRRKPRRSPPDRVNVNKIQLKDNNIISTSDVFDSPVDMTISAPITIPIATNRSPNNSPRSESIITDEGTFSPAVKKLIRVISVTQSRSGQGGVTLSRPVYTRHRRAKSCPHAIKRRDSKSSIKSLNFHRRHDYSQSSHDRSHDRSHDLSNSIDSHHKQCKRHSSVNIGKEWCNNGEDGDTESNGEEELIEDIAGDEPMSSAASSPMDTPTKHILTKQHEISPVVIVTPAQPINNKRGMIQRLLGFKKAYSTVV